eukprot:3684150-Prorocentrum_lima.AAC.1
MFPLKVAEHILQGCGPGKWHPELLLEMLHRHIQHSLLLTNVGGINQQIGPVRHVAATVLQQTLDIHGTPLAAVFPSQVPSNGLAP